MSCLAQYAPASRLAGTAGAAGCSLLDATSGARSGRPFGRRRHVDSDLCGHDQVERDAAVAQRWSRRHFLCRYRARPPTLHALALRSIEKVYFTQALVQVTVLTRKEGQINDMLECLQK